MVSSLVLKTTKSRSGNQGHPSEDKVKRAFETQFFRVWVRIHRSWRVQFTGFQVFGNPQFFRIYIEVLLGN